MPLLDVTKSVDNPTAAANDVVTYTVTLAHDPNSGTDAFDVDLSDVVPAGVTYKPGTWKFVVGTGRRRASATAGTLTATYDSFPKGSTATFSSRPTVDPDIAAYQTVTNTGADAVHLAAGHDPRADLAFNPNSVERTGNPADPGGAANNLNGSASASFTPTPSLDKRSPAPTSPSRRGIRSRSASRFTTASRSACRKASRRARSWRTPCRRGWPW